MELFNLPPATEVIVTFERHAERVHPRMATPAGLFAGDAESMAQRLIRFIGDACVNRNGQLTWPMMLLVNERGGVQAFLLFFRMP